MKTSLLSLACLAGAAFALPPKDRVAAMVGEHPILASEVREVAASLESSPALARLTLAERCDLVLVVGSPNSSNSRRLKEVASARGISAYLIDAADEIDADWLVGKQRMGITAGASAPEILVRQVVDRIVALTGATVGQLEGEEEGVSFPLPKELLQD